MYQRSRVSLDLCPKSGKDWSYNFFANKYWSYLPYFAWILREAIQDHYGQDGWFSKDDKVTQANG